MIYECKMCGACCSPQWLNDKANNVTYAAGIARPKDRVAICERLGVEDDELCERYGIIPETGHMQFVTAACRFLADADDDGFRKCTIHDIKPHECRAYPRPFVFKNGENKLRFAARCPGLSVEQDDIAEIQAWIDGVTTEFSRVCGDETHIIIPVDPADWSQRIAQHIRDTVDECVLAIQAKASVNMGPPVPFGF